MHRPFEGRRAAGTAVGGDGGRRGRRVARDGPFAARAQAGSQEVRRASAATEPRTIWPDRVACAPVDTKMGVSGAWGHRLLRWGSAGALLALTLAHPAYRADPAAQLERIGTTGWIPLHLGLLCAFAAFDVALLTWPGRQGSGGQLRRLGVVVHLVAYSAFVAVDGVAGGLLAGFAAGAPPALRPGLSAGLGILFTADPVVALALTAAVGWLVAVGAIVAELTAWPRYLPAAAFLVCAVATLTYRHSAPVGPVGAVLALLAAAALDLAGRRPARPSEAT